MCSLVLYYLFIDRYLGWDALLDLVLGLDLCQPAACRNLKCLVLGIANADFVMATLALDLLLVLLGFSLNELIS